MSIIFLSNRETGRVNKFEKQNAFFFFQLQCEWAQVQVIILNNDGNGFGFGISGSRNSGAVVRNIFPGGAADRVSEKKHELQITKRDRCAPRVRLIFITSIRKRGYFNAAKLACLSK